MAVVGGDDDEGVPQIGSLQDRPNRSRELDGLGQRPMRIAQMVAVVDAAALHHQEVPFWIAREDLERLQRHLGQRGLVGRVAGAVDLELHVRGLEQAQQVVRLAGGVELLAVPHVGRPGAPRDPLGGEVATVEAGAASFRVLGIRSRDGKEVHPSSAEHHLEPVAVGELDQLSGDIRKTRGAGLGSQ